MKSGRVHRLLRLITLLQSGRSFGVPQLMAELGVSRRTLFRDLKMLEAAGVPYYHDRETGYHIRESFFLPPVNLTVPETLGLMLMGRFAAAQVDKPLASSALSAIYKLVSTVPEPIRSACGEMLASVTVDPGAAVPGNRESAHHVALQQCIDERRACCIQYESPIEELSFEGTLEPYALHYAGRAWYVLGRTDVHKEVRVLKLARIRALQRTGKTFFRPRNFHVSDKLGRAWQLNPEGREYEVELVFAKRVATNVSEVRWHPTQQHRMLPDGRCRMRFTVDGLGEIAWWICGYADQVEIRKPVSLRRHVHTMLSAAAKKHRNGAGT